jgi:outer membrane lipopolysaccharide assembly protein LptE/RlpB
VVSLSAHAVIDGRLASADCATRAFCWLLVSVLGSCSFGLEQGRDFSQALYLRALNSNGSLSSTSTGRCLSKHAGLALDSVEGRQQTRRSLGEGLDALANRCGKS